MDFQQHKQCEKAIGDLVKAGRLLLVVYCHGWKNSSQSGDVVNFNAFLTKLAENEEIQKRGLRVHGVYLGWRGNAFLPYVEKSPANESYNQTLTVYGEAIVHGKYERRAYWTGAVPETLSYWSRKRAAEHLVSGLPMARAIFTYASAAKDYGARLDNRVCVMGHSFGALMLERSLGQAMSGALVMEWWDQKEKVKALKQPSLPFDMVLFVNSAAPSIYAKEMRDFLSAHRSALNMSHSAVENIPVIVSLTSTADWATGVVHPIGNLLSPVVPSLQRRYTTGIFGLKQPDGSYPTHSGVQQSDFYMRTPGHQPYLINHWIIKEDGALLPPDVSPKAVFTANLSTNASDANIFFTSKDKYPASAWRLTDSPQGQPVALDGLPPSMPNSDYWIVTCGKELIGGHNDVWSRTAMEMYAGLFRVVESRVIRNRQSLDPMPNR